MPAAPILTIHPAREAHPLRLTATLVNVHLLSTYDLGHQPLGLASPAAWLRDAGAQVTCNDLSLDNLDEDAVRNADLIATYLPMHTATRLAIAALPKIKSLNPGAHLCFFGLYAPLNADYLKSLGGGSFIGGEFESELVDLYQKLQNDKQFAKNTVINLEKQKFKTPDRTGLPALDRYAYLDPGDGSKQIVGYTEASRGCKHVCRHCPVVPIYNGQFRIVQMDVVMADVARQIDAGAQHISFGDPDFFNGPKHGIGIVKALHNRFPEVTYDVTIKVEHLLNQAEYLDDLAATGCLFVTTAVETTEDEILRLLDKGHDHQDLIKAVRLTRRAGLIIAPTFVPFTPWTTLQGFRDLLKTVAELGLVENVAPIQLAIRLLLPLGSPLLQLPEMAKYIGEFDQQALSYSWKNLDPRVEKLCLMVQKIVEEGAKNDQPRASTFIDIWQAAHTIDSSRIGILPVTSDLSGGAMPSMSEPWFCCAEPTSEQLSRL